MREGRAPLNLCELLILELCLELFDRLVLLDLLHAIVPIFGLHALWEVRPSVLDTRGDRSMRDLGINASDGGCPHGRRLSGLPSFPGDTSARRLKQRTWARTIFA